MATSTGVFQFQARRFEKQRQQTNKQNNESRCFWLYYFSVQVSSLGLYADNTTAYASNTKISALKLSPNQDLENLSSWFALNYLIRSMTRKPKQWSWVSTLKNLPFVLANLHAIEINQCIPEDSWCSYRR